MELVTFLVLLLITILAYCFLCGNVTEEKYEPVNPMKFNLIPRNKVPVKTRMMLNRFNEKSDPPPLDATIPDSFDARDEWPGLITEPMDQANCGSCWAFAICTTASDRIRINIPDLAPPFMKKQQYRGYKGIYTAFNNLDPFHLAACNLCKAIPAGPELAKQALCRGGDDSAPCAGEVLQAGMQFLQTQGTILTSCSPRQGPCLENADMCFYNCDEVKDCKLYKAMSVHPVNDEFTQAHVSDLTRSNLVCYEIMTYGPVVAGYTVYQSFMDFFKDPNNKNKVYSQDVKDNYQKEEEDLGGHAISIIGWGVDDEGLKYWLIRNSWGGDWNGDGCFKMERGTNFCGIGGDVWVSHWRPVKI